LKLTMNRRDLASGKIAEKQKTTGILIKDAIFTSCLLINSMMKEESTSLHLL